jgi:hypothetical protein
VNRSGKTMIGQPFNREIDFGDFPVAERRQMDRFRECD